jgi:hypothetical protein
MKRGFEMFNRSKYKPIMAAKYLGSKWMKSDGKSSVSLLDLYTDYQNWIVDNATGCDIELASFSKKISEVYPDALVKDGAVRGIAPKAKPPKPETIKKTQLEKDIEWALSYVFHNHSGIEYRGFETKYILKDISYNPSAPQITEEQLVDYLEKSDQFFRHPSKGYWLKEWRG